MHDGGRITQILARFTLEHGGAIADLPVALAMIDSSICLPVRAFTSSRDTIPYRWIVISGT